MSHPTTQVIRSPGGSTICFADFGPPDGYPVLVLHQSPGCRLSMRWPDRVAALGGRLISYDRPGCGQSPRKRGRSVVDCVPDVEAVVDGPAEWSKDQGDDMADFVAALLARKRAEGKSWREALRALKRHLARIVFRLLSQPATQVSSLGLD